MDNYFIVQTGFILTTFVFFGLVLHMLNSGLSKTSFSPEKQRKIFRIALLSLICWMMFTGFLAAANFFNDFSTMPPKFFIVLIVPLVAVIYLSTRKSLTEILRHVPPSNIMFLQGFRIVVEILLWMLFLENVLPVQMTFEGYNFDVLAGISGVIMGWLYTKGKLSPTLVTIWNFAGLALLLNIVTIALLSTPLPIRVFMNEPANTIVTVFPIIWLPAMLVPLAYGLHIMSLKQMSLLRKESNTSVGLA